MRAMEQSDQPTVGDVIVVGGHTVRGDRRFGEILEIRGDPGYERYRVRWEDGHESIFHPADGEATIRHYAPHGASVELMRMLTEMNVEFEPRRHPRTGTAMDEARSLHASPEVVGKTIVVHAPEGMIRVVIPAPERLSLPKLRVALEQDDLRFATEAELGDTYPSFELGAVPPFSGPEDERVVIDSRIASLESVIVEAGSHSDSVRLAANDLVRITGALVTDVIAD
jgi:Ala-tRNA(Pro) deacylase